MQFVSESFGFAGIKPVGYQQYQCAPTHQLALVQGIQRCKALSELGATGEVFDGSAGLGQHVVRIGMRKSGVQVSELVAEGEHMALQAYRAA